MRGLVFMLLLGACGGDSSDAIDAGPPIDARFLDDAAITICSSSNDPCAELPFERLCDTQRMRCVECNRSEDCQTPPSLGSACNTERGTCECVSSQNCEGNLLGHYCHPVVSACGCITDKECPQGRECKLEPYLGTGIRTCQDTDNNLERR